MCEEEKRVSSLSSVSVVQLPAPRLLLLFMNKNRPSIPVYVRYSSSRLRETTYSLPLSPVRVQSFTYTTIQFLVSHFQHFHCLLAVLLCYLFTHTVCLPAARHLPICLHLHCTHFRITSLSLSLSCISLSLSLSCTLTHFMRPFFVCL